MEFTAEEIELVNKLIKGRYKKLGQQWVEDLLQEGFIALYTAKLRFTNERHGNNFLAYANVSIRGRVKNYLRDRYSIIRTPRTEDDREPVKPALVISGDVVVGSESNSDMNIFDMNLQTYFDETESVYYLSPYFDLMTEREKEIVKYRLDGMSQSAIAKELGTNQMKISRELKHLQNKIMEQEWFDAI